MRQIEDVVKKHGWTQKQAAKMLGLTQSRISELMSSHSEKFTIDKLIKLLYKLDRKVEIKVKPRNKILKQ
jgi:predicted XRE-type DNA-binding protein